MGHAGQVLDWLPVPVLRQREALLPTPTSIRRETTVLNN